MDRAVTQVIITAAGLGSRLRPHTDDRPKCMVEVAGEPMLHRATRICRAAGLGPVTVVVGYMKDRVHAPGIDVVDNLEFERNNSLHSLYCARDRMEGGFIFSYADIVYEPFVVDALRQSTGDIVLVVETAWREAYVGRTLHPLEQAELVRCGPDGALADVGKGVAAEGCTGEFIGMGRMTAAGARAALEVYAAAERREREDGTHPYERAASYQRAYLTDLFRVLVARGHRVDVCRVQRGFMEIDTPQDLDRARERFRSP